MGQHGLHWLDYVVILGYLGLIVSVGVSFSKRQKNTSQYFTGGGAVPTWAVGFSILATLISSVTFLAYPGEGFKGDWIRLVQGLMVPVVLILIVWFIVPMYRHAIRLSAYEYFEKRFGLFARLYSSLAFVLMHFSKMGTVFYLLALALAEMSGLAAQWDYGTYATIWALGILVVIYTLLGGIEAVIWCDVIQGFMLMGGGLICVLVLLFVPAGGPSAVFETLWSEGKMNMGPFNLDFVHLTFIVMALNGVFYALAKYTTDQTIVQRYLAAKSDRAAIKASLIGVLLCVPIWGLFIFIGSALYVFYQQTPLPPGLKADKVFPFFIMTQLPVGVTGLIVAALIAAALSSLDSDLNCLSAIGVEDYYARLRPQSTDKQRLLMGRVLVAVGGLFAILVACWYVQSGGENALAIVFTLYAIFSGGIAGMFALAFLTKRANKQGLYVGIAACVLFTAWALLTSKPIMQGERPLLDLGAWNFHHHKYMVGVYSHVVLFVVGYLASFLFKTDKRIADLTVYDWWQRRRVLEHREGEKPDGFDR